MRQIKRLFKPKNRQNGKNQEHNWQAEDKQRTKCNGRGRKKN